MEAAKLAHNMQVTAVAWQDRDAGVITLGDNGIVSTWTRSVSVFLPLYTPTVLTLKGFRLGTSGNGQKFWMRAGIER